MFAALDENKLRACIGWMLCIVSCFRYIIVHMRIHAFITLYIYLVQYSVVR